MHWGKTCVVHTHRPLIKSIAQRLTSGATSVASRRHAGAGDGLTATALLLFVSFGGALLLDPKQFTKFRINTIGRTVASTIAIVCVAAMVVVFCLVTCVVVSALALFFFSFSFVPATVETVVVLFDKT